jgi:hypothetical protein
MIKTYWFAWLILLVITVTMVFLGSKPVLIAGMSVKAAIILLWFMHLKYERLMFSVGILAAIFFTALLLFGLIVPDGLSM